MQSDCEGVSRLLERFSATRILVIGDLMLDEFIWGKVSRISPEAPVPVVNVTGESYYPGGAANVARNVAELTASATLMGTCGKDPAGKRLMEFPLMETVTVQRLAGFKQFSSWLGMHPDGTLLIARDLSTQEIYQLQHSPR